MAELSPMMKQYLAIKEQNPDCVIFFRLGDFYEMFFEDAERISKELDLTLTGRDCGLEERAPMCGVPYHASDGYIAKLIKKGYKVAICEQVEDPALAKGLVKREIVRTVTPGTVTDTSMLDESTNNYLACMYKGDQTTAMCFADISTGGLYLTEFDSADAAQKIRSELGAFRPHEFILNDTDVSQQLVKFCDDRLGCICFIKTDEYFEFEDCKKTVTEHFGKSLEEMDLKQADTIALGVILNYLVHTSQSNLENITSFNRYSQEQFMRLDPDCIRNLELFETMRSHAKKGSLLWALDKTNTSMGRRKLHAWLEHPLTNPLEIIARQNGVDALSRDSVLTADLKTILSGIHDLERIISRAVYGAANPQELVSLSAALKKIPELKSLITNVNSNLIGQIYQNLFDFSALCDLIDRSIREDAPLQIQGGNIIKPGYNETLDELKNDMGSSKDILAEIEQREKTATGIKNLKIGYNKVFGYYIEVTNSYKSLVPQEWIRKQTLTGGERYITEELKKIESRLLGASERSVALEYKLFCEVRDAVASEFEKISLTADAVATLDVLNGFAINAIENNYICPDIATDGKILIEASRHPVIERLTDSPFVPNDIKLDNRDNLCCVITGPNMAGKSTYMRQCALICIMAQIGSFVPASKAHIGVVDAIYTRIGASDDLSSGQSTFMVEMNEVANILNNATRNSLILLDEIGRGTSTYDGMAIARAVLEYTAKKNKLGAKTLFATHYHELTSLEGELEGVVNYNVVVKKRGEGIIFLHRIVRGGSDKSYGIEVARLAGINKWVIDRANQILKEYENERPVMPVMSQQPSEDVSTQIGFADASGNEIVKKIKQLDVESLTPIEALNELYKLKKEIDR